MVIRRTNKIGKEVVFRSGCPDHLTTDVFCDGKTMVINEPIEKLMQSWYDWDMRGNHIQHAFSYLNDDQREFLMTGITPEEWAKIFPPEDEE